VYKTSPLPDYIINLLLMVSSGYEAIPAAAVTVYATQYFKNIPYLRRPNPAAVSYIPK
jgi:hypothetical protein